MNKHETARPTNGRVFSEREAPGLPYAPGQHANVCLILEGTFPYVRGGVSTWIEQIVSGLPELTFSIVFLAGVREELGEPAYRLPSNVVHVEVHGLLGGRDSSKAELQESATTVATGSGLMRGSARLLGRAAVRVGDLAMGRQLSRAKRRFGSNRTLHRQLAECDGEIGHATGAAFTELLSGNNRVTEADLARHEMSWELIREKYGDAPAGLDFNHFFWTIRSMHEPLFVLGDVCADAPPADLYHAVSTGYAGWLGAMISQRRGAPFFISEHGIYTKEREIDLAQVDWIPDDLDPFHVGLDDGMSYLRQVWIRFFRSLGRMSYASATRVFTLHEGNRRRQIEDGAPADKLTIIPNGVDVRRYARARRPVNATVPPVLALIGRVVPIKDTKTFIRGMREIRARLPDAEGWLVGPTDEDPAYTQECRLLIESLGLEDCVRMLGFQRPEDVFPRIGLNVLTSVSEGQPLTVLEGFAAGIPALTTDVGSCRELVMGNVLADRELGRAGAVVPIRQPTLFADAAVALLDDAAAWRRASHAAIERVESWYDQRDMLIRYGDAYRGAIEAHAPWQQAS